MPLIITENSLEGDFLNKSAKYSLVFSASEALEKAVDNVLEQGLRTIDLMSDTFTQVGCTEMGNELLNCLE